MCKTASIHPKSLPADAVRQAQSTIPHLQSAFRIPQSLSADAFRQAQSAIRHPPSAIRIPQSAIRNPKSEIRHLTSHIPHPKSLHNLRIQPHKLYALEFSRVFDAVLVHLAPELFNGFVAFFIHPELDARKNFGNYRVVMLIKRRYHL